MIIFLSIYFLDFFQDEEKKIPNLYVSFFHYFAILKFNLNFSKFYAQNASLEKPSNITNCISIFTFLKVTTTKKLRNLNIDMKTTLLTTLSYLKKQFAYK